MHERRICGWSALACATSEDLTVRKNSKCLNVDPNGDRSLLRSSNRVSSVHCGWFGLSLLVRLANLYSSCLSGMKREN